MSTRYSDPTWDECPSCGAVVAAGSSFCPECGERLDIRRAPARDHEPRRRDQATPPWLPAVLGLGAAAVLGIGVLVFLLLTSGTPPVVGDASATPSASASGQPSSEPSASAEPSEEPTPSPTPTATPRPAQANRSIVSVTADGAELRTQPGAGDVIGTLGTGARAFIIGSPQDAAGERWYRVAVVSGPYSECEGDFCPPDIGYLADGASEADAILAAASLDCPSSPMTSDELGALLPLERLACYGANPIVVTGTLNACFCDGPIGTSYSPAWLASPITALLFDNTFDLWLRFEDETPEELEPGDIVEATMAMEHEAAPECLASGSDAPSKASIVLSCRTQLVVEDLEVIGFDDSIQP